MIRYYIARAIRKLKPRAIAKSSIDATACIGPGTQVYMANVGRYSYCGSECSLLFCSIGSFCSIADDVMIGGAMHSVNAVSTSPVFHAGRNDLWKVFHPHESPAMPNISIGSDVWIGKGAKIKSGVSIGNGVVIGMGAVVTKDVPSYAVVAGVPAHIIRYRFDESMRADLEAAAWWNWTDEEISRRAHLFSDPRALLESLK